ncbi:nitrogenase iron-molybdenum cofactor biosynthesis protein NifE [Nostoc sp. FACHB-152]|uniref:nitrogenase component 1 n=1 Tax=unclassified Nostoc TaxID=2593658 RepID=UPI0016892D32|nr:MULTISPECIES: nitrogenase component 1 [unclassified Nostoc]MBD2448526.1 nitrogenase iron-molybdenum cofactor biosynthesis protein NifE [Nostoc sp. FACHB-152]MBD2466263.1 nitrogenase iron-molybdenum cofactor biosynthesis protein NifE [Nostoc sp. FACHB-145]
MKTNQGNTNRHPHNSMPDNEDRFGMEVPSALDVHEDCAFDGAMLTLVPIVDAAHLIHGPSGCMSNYWGNHSNLSSDSKLNKVRFTTDMEESDIIFGGANKLQKAILQLVRRYQPSAVFVYSTCVSALIGDDIHGACNDAHEQTGIPIIPVDSPGFAGRKNLGIRLAGETLIEQVIGTAEPEFITPYDINIISEYDIASAVNNILPLLEKLGIRVLAKIICNTHYKEICYAHRAKLNVLISAKVMLKFARKMQDKFDIPYIEASLYDVEDINQLLRSVAAKLGNNELRELTENLISEEVDNLSAKLTFYKSQLEGKTVIIDITDSPAWEMISSAKSLGMNVIPISSGRLNQEDRNRLKQLLDRDDIVLVNDKNPEITLIINENQADLFIASNSLNSLACQFHIPFLNINPERHHVYAGYAGVLAAAQELYATIYSPVWSQVRKSAPWEEVE